MFDKINILKPNFSLPIHIFKGDSFMVPIKYKYLFYRFFPQQCFEKKGIMTDNCPPMSIFFLQSVSKIASAHIILCY